MSSVQLDGTHTPAKRGGQAVGHQGRKKCRTSNILILTDAQAMPLACGDAIAGKRHDSYEPVKQIGQMWSSVESTQIRTEGLFLNADAGFAQQSSDRIVKRRK